MSAKKRFPEIDIVRGITVVLMLAFNYAFTLRYLDLYSAGGGWAFWWLFPRLIAGTFIFLAGMSLTLSISKHGAGFRKFLLRGAKIFGCGLLVTLATWLYLGRGFVVFGILHFIGLATVLAYPFRKGTRTNLLLAGAFLAAGALLSGRSVNFPWLLLLGIPPEGFYTVDYFPFVPWFGVILAGIACGNLLYPQGSRSFRMPNLPESRLAKALSYLGRNSLVVYLAHQPALMAALYLLGLV